MSDTDEIEAMKNWNQQIMDEFRSNQGVVGGPFEGQLMVLLTTTGAKSGQPHTNPLVAGRAGDDLYVIASAGGSHRHPAWYHNLSANPTVTVELGTETFEARAHDAEEPQRRELYAAMVERMPQFAGYQEDNPRTIPVVILERT